MTGDYRLEDPLLQNRERSVDIVAEEDTTDTEGETIWETVWNQALKKAQSWKAPGHDGICAFWWKHFPKAAIVLRKLLGKVVEWKKNIPQWLVRGEQS